MDNNICWSGFGACIDRGESRWEGFESRRGFEGIDARRKKERARREQGSRLMQRVCLEVTEV